MSRPAHRILLHLGGGLAVAAGFVLALLATDPGGIGGLLLGAEEGLWPLLLLWLFSGLTFGVALGATALAQPEPERPAALRPVPVRVPARRGRR